METTQCQFLNLRQPQSIQPGLAPREYQSVMGSKMASQVSVSQSLLVLEKEMSGLEDRDGLGLQEEMIPLGS